MRRSISETDGSGPDAGATANNRAIGRPREVITTSSPLLAFRRYRDSLALNSRTDVFMGLHYRQCGHIARTLKSKIADSTQLFGYLPHHGLRQPAEQPKQSAAIDRPGLINHHFAGAGVTGHAPR